MYGKEPTLEQAIEVLDILMREDTPRIINYAELKVLTYRYYEH